MLLKIFISLTQILTSQTSKSNFNSPSNLKSTNFCIKDVTAVIPITVFFDIATLSYFDRFYLPPNAPPSADGLYKLSHFLITTFSDLNDKLIEHGVQVRAIIKENLMDNFKKAEGVPKNVNLRNQKGSKLEYSRTVEDDQNENKYTFNPNSINDETNFCSSRSPTESSMKYFESLVLKQPNYVPSTFMLINYCSHMSTATSTASYTSNNCNNVIAFRIETIEMFYNDLVSEIPRMLSKVRDNGDVFENNSFHQELCRYVRTCVESTSKSAGYFVEGVHLISDGGELKSLERKNSFSG